MTRLARFPGSGGAYASTPDSAAFSALGSFSMIFLGSMADYTPGADQSIMGHLATTGSQRSWRLSMNGSTNIGKFQMQTSSNGSSNTINVCSVTSGISDGDVKWILVTRNTSNGQVKFYTAPFTPGDVSPPAIGSFTQLGTTITGATGSLFNSTATLNVGAYGTGSDLLAGDCYRAMLYSNLYGGGSESLLRDFNPNDAPNNGATSWTSQTTGETWTLNGSMTMVETSRFPKTMMVVQN